ncbi:MAG: hypothetical protein K8W52_03025 [Deltaproteobacteria bacterium]|nr:hypothetical protein [Deltaproteobacteria bacterium]
MTISTHARLGLSILTALGLAACGGSKPVATGPTPPAEGGDMPAVGTSGMPGLDWGATADAVIAKYPRGTADAAGVVYLGTIEGHQAIAHFTIGDQGLSKIEIEWTDGFISMDDCGKGWNELRPTLDARLGASQADNLMATWTTATADVTLTCSPNDSGAGVLSQSYAPHAAE